ncbi:MULTISPECIES: tetratricopeptide repeat protein [unclassified Duganella]|jgi:ketosteroid isomerase-like protein|uniref:L,D-transpeptidase Cds6 family protein n=1 Tax=unclassified Duganella TaxID=2636909 RepID=UPI00088AEF27|nr:MULTISPECIES: tetratricopeptide repeat protein [unclassified Duganella]SDG13416.1 protein of unknown function [Duganella sp. OV458]SDJ34809.1 protein of unknown function [Duganella sp. OV510]
MKFAAQKMLYVTLALLVGTSAQADDTHAADAQARFRKGVLLTEQNKPDEAIAVFTRLTEDYKDLPEPYNNLAVLYAAQGQYDKARVVLEKALRTNPAYHTAYENLGDIYGKLASQAYDKALGLGTPTTPAKSNLTLLRALAPASVTLPFSARPVAVAASAPQKVASVASAVVPPTAPPPPKAAAPVVAQPTVSAPAKVAAVAPTVAQQPVSALSKVAAATPAVPAPVASAPVKVVAAPVPAPAPKPATPPPARPDTSERDAVMAQVHGWAKAWAAQNVDSYLGYYSQQFEPPKGLTRKAWADERRARIEGKGRIRVEVASPEVSVNGNIARVTFRQTYESDRLTARSRKTLVLVKNGGKWQIKQEVSN